VTYICNPSTWEAQAGELRVPGQPGLHNKTVPQQNKTNKKQINKIIFKNKIDLNFVY
jgi:hypothetical protein